MFFSAKEFMNWVNSSRSRIGYIRSQYDNLIPWSEATRCTPVTLKECRTLLRAVKDMIVDRDMNPIGGLHKWYRPWEIVPALRDFQAPVGDYGVGIEVEMGFRDRQAARDVARHIKDWKHIALDYEGGHDPIETTFPPVLYSKFGPKSQAIRYLKYLNTVRHLVEDHSNNRSVGTHVNVSVGGVTFNSVHHYRITMISRTLQASSSGYSSDYSGRAATAFGLKYFGRQPYGYGHNRGGYIEWKLFNSQLDPKRLTQYVDIAVALTKLVVSTTVLINTETVTAALEEGFNKRKRKKAVQAAVPVTPELAIAA